MLILVRALVWGSAFVAFVLVFLPAQVLDASGLSRPGSLGSLQVIGALLAAAGVVPMAWSFLSFVFRGRGTPAPFDPPRLLVVDGPYRYVRNPMYLGAILSLLGVALFSVSPWLLAYTAAFVLWAHLFVVGYEEPRLRRSFGDDYAAYAARVHRWLPRTPAGTGRGPTASA